MYFAFCDAARLGVVMAIADGHTHCESGGREALVTPLACP